MSTDDQGPVYYPKISPYGRVLGPILQSLLRNMRTRSSFAEIAKNSRPVRLQVRRLELAALGQRNDHCCGVTNVRGETSALQSGMAFFKNWE
jgi:hypothetical protein